MFTALIKAHFYFPPPKWHARCAFSQASLHVILPLLATTPTRLPFVIPTPAQREGHPRYKTHVCKQNQGFRVLYEHCSTCQRETFVENSACYEDELFVVRFLIFLIGILWCFALILESETSLFTVGFECSRISDRRMRLAFGINFSDREGF